jgi:TfoX/Sxy family transcriptional regulator of competence genes
MFSYRCAFRNGNMFIGLHEAGLVLRLDSPDREDFRTKTGATEFEPMPGRKMREYSVVPQAILDSPAKLKPWALKSFAYASTLPAKQPKPRTGKSGEKSGSRAAKPKDPAGQAKSKAKRRAT